MPTVPPTPAATPTPAAPLGGAISLPTPPPPAPSQPPPAPSQPPTAPAPAPAPSPSLYEAITDYIDATNAGMNRRADPRDAILNLPEDAPDPAKRHIAAQAFEAITGIRSPDGSILTPGRTPLDGAAYAAKVRDILKRGTASLRSPEYQAWLDIPEDDEERRYQTALAALSPIRRAAAKFGASVEASRAEHADPDLRSIDSLYGASLGPTPPAPAPSDPAAPTADSPLPTATAPDAPETRASVIAEYEAKLAADHFLELYAAAAPALSEPARDMIRRAAQSGSRGILTQDAETFRTLPKKEQRVASSLISSALPPRSRNFLRDMGLGILDLAERMTVNLARQTEDMGFQPPPPMFGTAASYARLAEIAAERAAMSQEQRDAERLTANLWRQASTPRAFDGYSLVEEAFIGAATTVPYMLMAGIPYIGAPLVAIDQFQNVRDRVLLEGGNPNQAQAAQWAAAIAYAYIEKLSAVTAFGRPLSTLGMRSVFLNVSRHGYAYAARQIGTEIAGVTVAETIQEMLQRATEEATVAGLLDKDIAASAARGFIEEAQTWNTMLLIGGLGTAKKAASAKWARASNLDLAETVTARLRALTAIQESSSLPQPKSPDTQKRLALARKIWTEAPSDLQALARLQSELDLDRDRAIAIADYFGLENALLHSTRTPEGRKQYRQAITLDPAFLQTLLPGATITPLTPDPAAPAAPTAPSPLPTATATAANPEPKKTITRKRTLPNGRRVTQELPNPAHAAWLSARQEASTPAPGTVRAVHGETPAPAPAPQRYRLDFPVTLLDGTRSTASYTIEAGALDPDLSTPAAAAEVQQITGGSVRADDYLAMTPEQQAEILAANGLAVRSQWKLTAPDGSSATTSGLISLITSPGPGTARATNLDLIHEHLHAVAGILKAAGVLTPERVATMRQLFGDPTYAGEDFDEESAAEALAANLLGRDPHPEAEPIFSAIRAGARRLLETLKVIPPEAELSARAQALDIAFEALRTGDLSLLDPFSGITFADETDAAPAPSDPAASRGTATSVSSAPDAQSTNIPPADPDDPAASASAVEAARAAVPPAASRGTATSVSSAPADQSPRTGLRAEIAALNDKVDRLMQLLASGAPIPASRPTGQSVSIVTPTGNIRFTAEWHAVELDDLVTSDNPGYPQEFQPRDRSTVTSRVQVLKFSAPGAFDPERLFDSAESDGGSPVTAGGLTVISGNGRVMILREVANAGRWQEYDTAARAFAARAGITIPDGMRRPVLVRRVTSVADRATLVKIAELSNRPKILQRNESELAEADAKLLTPDLVSIYAPGSDANLLAASNAPFMQAFARAAQAEGDLDSNGKPTQALAMRVRNAFLAALLGEGADTRDLIRTLIEQSGELGMRTLLNSLIDHAGPAIALHHAKPELSILAALRAAVRSYVSWKTSGTRATLADHLAQGDLLAAPPSPALAIMLTAAEQGRLGPLLDRYAELARAIDTQTADMFGATPDPLPLLQKADADTRPAGAPAASSRPPPRPPAPPPPRPEPPDRFTPAPLQPTAIDTPENVPTWTLLGTAGKAVPTANAPDSDRSDQIPLFQGGKRSLAARAEAAIKRLMTPSERARYTVIWDGFGGSGGWGLYHANTSLPNVREISIGEFNPSRMAKIKFFHTQGHRLAEVEASPEFQAFKARVIANMTKRNKDGETVAATSAGKLAASISNTIKENGPQLSDDVIAIAQAIADRAANGSQDAADTREMIYAKILDGLIKDAAAIQSAAQEFRDRGGTFTYRTQRDTYKADLIPGSNVFTIIDPPYYLTSDYDEENATTSDKVGLDTYQQTLELIRRSAAAGNAVLYTDSAWWTTKEFTPQPAEILFGETHSTEQKILLDIFNTLDHLDIVDGKVGLRQEIIGVHHAHTTDAATATGQRSLRSTDEPARREQTDGPIPAPAGNGPVRDQDIPGVAKGDAGQAAALRSANDPGRDLAAPAASSQLPLPTAPATAPSPDPRHSLQPRETDPLGLYSRLREHLRAKMPARATAEALRNLTDPAKGHGIRADELRWTGFQDFLDALPPGSTVTKEAALAAIADPPLTETVLGDPANLIPGAFGGSVQRSPDTATSYEQYTTPGAVPGTYRERLISLTPAPATNNGFSIIPDPFNPGRLAIRNPQGAIIETWLSDPEARERLASYVEVTRTDTYQSSHWPHTPNVLLHIRHADRLLPDGSTALDAEEFQSDWHQDGREKGYRPRNQAEYNKHILSKYPTLPADPDEWSYPMLQEAGLTTDEIAHLSDQASDARVPPAPYADTSKGWATLAARRILRIAAERGLRTVTWTTGRTQIERFEDSFRQAVDTIEWFKEGYAQSNVLIARKAGGIVQKIEYKSDGTVSSPDYLAGQPLSAVIGKDAATKVLAAPAGRLSGDDLHIGGEGMIEFYDRIMPRVFATLGKPYAAAPSTVTLTEDAKSLAALNDRAREIADHIAEYGEYESLDLSEDNVASRVFGALIDDPELSFSAAIDNERAADPDNSEKAERDALVRFVGKAAAITRHRFDIPPAMAADILAGQPRFSLQPRNPASAAEEIAKLDAEYMAAVERGDMETAQRMVDDAAKAAGYNVGPVYHGTRTDFNVPRTRGMSAFDERLANVRGDNDAGMFFSNVRDTAKDFAQRGRRGDHMLTASEINNDVWPEGARIVDAYLRLDNPKEFDGVGDFISYRSENFNRIQDALREEGHDGIVLRDASYDASNPDETWYIATDPSQIKSADAITRDGAGDVIPPSERFNEDSDDIRFSIRRTSRRNPASNVEALITARILAGKPAAPADVAAILKNAGIRTAETPEQILARANARAQALPAAEAGRVRAADPALFERLANDAERDRLAARIGESFGAGAQAAAPAIGAAAGLALARERTARAAIESAAGFTAAEMQAELGIDLAATVLNTPDIQPTADELDARANEREAARREAELAADLDAEADPAPLPPSPEMTALLNQVLAAAEARSAAEALERQRRDMEKQRKAARSAESTDDPALDDDPDTDPAAALEPDPVYRLVAPLISNPEEFAQFIREWVRRRLAKTRPEDDPAAPFRHPAALRDLQRTAQHILADLARQLLGTGGPRIAAEHAIARLADAPTERSTIRDIADIYSRIHRGALRESRKDIIARLQREIARLAKDTGRWQENKEDLRRKVTAATERWARTLSEYIALSPDRLLGETRRLQKIIADADTDPADPAAPSDTDDRKLREALDKLAILQTYGGMINWMPGQIAEAADSITAHLNGERQAHEARRLEAEAAAASIRGTLIKAVRNPDESAPAPEPGGFSRFADSLIGNLQLRLNYLIRFAKGTDRQDAIAAIDDIMTELGRGAEQYRVIQSDAHEALGTALEQIYGDRRAAARRLDTPIPAPAQAALSRQGVRLTYGRAIQLYASILQRHYAENVRIHKRAKDLDTLRTVLDSRDLALHQWLVAWYAAQRGRLSEAQQLVTGCPVLSEDRLYMPAVILREPSGFRGRHAAWTPIAASLTPRVRHRLDFDERASVLDVFADRLEDNALIRAYGPRGIFLRDAVAHQSVQSAVTRFHGSAQRSALMNQIEDTLRGGRQVTRSDAWLAPANTARRWITRFYLPGNVVSAAKQIASVPVWANIVGFRNLARYMFDIDSAAIRELMQSPGFRARYASGWSEETANILSDHRRNPVAKLYDAGLLPNRTVDAVAGLWIAQGVYRDLKATLTDRGYSADEARSRAQTLTWNLIEQTQQSARTEMLLLIQREQPLTRVLFQFANSPIQQMQFELEAFREFKAGTPGSRPRLARALIINHVLVPAILLSIEGFFNALLGRQPEDDRWRHWLVASILGQFSALFIIGSLGERGLITLLGGKYPYWKTDELPLAGIKRPFQSAFDLIRHTALYGADALTPGDFSEVTAADILTDLHNLGRATVAPYRHISEAVRNRRD